MLIKSNLNYSISKPLIAVTILLWGCTTIGFSQKVEMTVDRQYEVARQAAFSEKDYQKARKYAFSVLRKAPAYHEVRVFAARLYSWERLYNEARKELNYVLNQTPDNRAALIAIIDVESWSEKYKEAIRWTELALKYYPQDEEFLLAKANFARRQGNLEQAEQIYSKIMDLHPGSINARQELKSLSLQQMNYRATLSYRRDQFSQIFDPWNFWEIQLNRQTGLGPIIGRVQYANRFSTNGVQFNIDAYPSLTKGLYSYINVGYSQSSIYPDIRFGVSLYKSLPLAFELEGGLRYLNFTTSETIIYTASLSKYLGSYLFTGRTYLVPSLLGTSQSFNLLTRRYFSNAQKYFGINTGFGSASSDIQFLQDIQRLDSWSISVEGQYPLNQRFNIGGNVGFDSEEFTYYKRDRFSFKMYLSYQF